MLLNSNGTVSSIRDYDASGQMLSQAPRDRDPFGFTGGLDAGNGLWKLGARFYDSGKNSFIQQDRYMGDPLSLNRYVYCGLDPVNFVDPTGFVTQQLTINNGSPLHKLQREYEKTLQFVDSISGFDDLLSIAVSVTQIGWYGNAIDKVIGERLSFLNYLETTCSDGGSFTLTYPSTNLNYGIYVSLYDNEGNYLEGIYLTEHDVDALEETSINIDDDTEN